MKISNYGGGFAGLSFKSSASFYVIFSDLFSDLFSLYLCPNQCLNLRILITKYFKTFYLGFSHFGLSMLLL